jgi:hypothetical protein
LKTKQRFRIRKNKLATAAVKKHSYDGKNESKYGSVDKMQDVFKGGGQKKAPYEQTSTGSQESIFWPFKSRVTEILGAADHVPDSTSELRRRSAEARKFGDFGPLPISTEALDESRIKMAYFGVYKKTISHAFSWTQG